MSGTNSPFEVEEGETMFTIGWFKQNHFVTKFEKKNNFSDILFFCAYSSVQQ
jgi:hypothetical protein